jgi:hypothetical protein
MNDFFEILKYTMPAVIVSVVTVFIIYAFFKDARIRSSQAFNGDSRKITLNLRLQVYERITLFLERISPRQLVMRLNKPGMAGLQLQWEMIKTVNDEFEHNFSQQIYVSIELWDMVIIAKESVIRQINTSANKLNEQSTGENLAHIILEDEMKSNTNSTHSTLISLKKEVHQMFL